MRKNSISKTQKRVRGNRQTELELNKLLLPFTVDKNAKIPPRDLMRGVDLNSEDVFDTFTKLDDRARNINFVKDQASWNDCLLEEVDEFNTARQEYLKNKTPQNYDHMEEEMGDIIFTAASMAKNAGIDAKEAFKTTNRKFFNRINIMEILAQDPKSNTPNNLRDCKSHERRALWNTAKRKLYDAQALQYMA